MAMITSDRSDCLGAEDISPRVLGIFARENESSARPPAQGEQGDCLSERSDCPSVLFPTDSEMESALILGRDYVSTIGRLERLLVCLEIGLLLLGYNLGNIYSKTASFGFVTRNRVWDWAIYPEGGVYGKPQGGKGKFVLAFRLKHRPTSSQKRYEIEVDGRTVDPDGGDLEGDADGFIEDGRLMLLDDMCG